MDISELLLTVENIQNSSLKKEISNFCSSQVRCYSRIGNILVRLHGPKQNLLALTDLKIEMQID